MRVSELKKEMDGRFVELRADTDGRFVELKTDMDGRFVDFRQEVGKRFAHVDARFVEMENRIAAEGEATRRYFDIVAEQLRADFRLVFDKVIAIDEKLARFNASNE